MRIREITEKSHTFIFVIWSWFIRRSGWLVQALRIAPRNEKNKQLFQPPLGKYYINEAFQKVRNKKRVD